MWGERGTLVDRWPVMTFFRLVHISETTQGWWVVVECCHDWTPSRFTNNKMEVSKKISNGRTHWTDPEKTWVFNSFFCNLLRGPLVRSHSSFDGRLALPLSSSFYHHFFHWQRLLNFGGFFAYQHDIAWKIGKSMGTGRWISFCNGLFSGTNTFVLVSFWECMLVFRGGYIRLEFVIPQREGEGLESVRDWDLFEKISQRWREVFFLAMLKLSCTWTGL